MDVTSFCENVSKELTGWKAKVDGIVKKLDKMPILPIPLKVIFSRL